MQGSLRTIALGVALFLVVAVGYDSAETVCIMFPNNGKDIFGVAQRNIIIFDEGEVSLIPQVHFEGDSRDFGILVPVPARPRLSTVGANVFTEASFLTQPAIRQSSGCGCEDDSGDLIFASRVDQAGTGALVDSDESGVTIIHEQIVGTFSATVLQASTAADLTAWLTENQYQFDPDDSDVLEEYVSLNWFFVAMKLDTAQVPPQVGLWWTATTSPARITFPYESESFPYALRLTAISTDQRADILVYTIAPNPMTFPGATVEYANEISESEASAMTNTYPQLAGLIPPGSFVTKLRRNFSKAEMQSDVDISPTEDRTEFRQITYVNNGGLNFVALILLALVAFLRKRKA